MIELPAPKNTFQDADIKRMLAKKGLDFNVNVVPTPNPVGDCPTGFYTAYRDTDRKVFQQGITDQWKPIQNLDVFKCVAELSKQTEAKLIDIRSFHDGAEIAGGFIINDIAPTVGFFSQNERDIPLKGQLENMLNAVDDACFLAVA